jgi:hypothetical protein
VSKEKWYDSDDPDRVGRALTGRGILLIILAVVVIGGISIGIWAFKVQTSGVKGAGDVKRTNNSAPNRIKAQAEFESLYAGIVAADKKIDIHAAALKANPKDFVLQTNYTAALTFCTTLVADYDAAARKTTFADWRAEDLPSRIDVSDPATDCKGSAK